MCDKFDLPTKTTIDAPLIVGSTIFGLGWGLAGICPGPGVIGVFLNGVSGGLYMLGFALGRGAAELWSAYGKREERN